MLITYKFFRFLVITIGLSVSAWAYSQSVTSSSVTENALNTVGVDFVFTPEVSTFIGFNIDYKTFGMEGNAKLSANLKVYEKESEEFIGKTVVNNKNVYAEVKIEELEILFDYDSSDMSTYEASPSSINNDEQTHVVPLTINWGKIYAGIFFDVVYVRLTHTFQDSYNFVQQYKDENLLHSVISYDVLPASYTASRREQFYYVNDTFRFVDSKAKRGDESIYNAYNTLKSKNIANTGVGLGMLFPQIIDMRVSLISQYSYVDILPLDRNPIAVELYLRFLSFENLIFENKSSIFIGVDGNDVLGINNPITLESLVGYSFDVNDIFSVVPKFGVEYNYTLVNRFSENRSVFLNEFNLSIDDNASPVVSQVYELLFSIVLQWSDKKTYKKDYLEANGDKTESVTNGLSFSVMYGETVDEGFRELSMPYVGFKVAVWDSEDDSGTGLIPFTQLGMVLNYNYSLGASLDKIEGFIQGSETKYIVFPRMDIGLLLEAQISVNIFKINFGILTKILNLQNTYDVVYGSILSSDNVDGSNIQRIYLNRADLRIKCGFKLVKIIPNTEFELLYESGDFITSEPLPGIEDRALDESRFFRNQNKEGSYSFLTDNQYGYISLGVTIKF